MSTGTFGTFEDIVAMTPEPLRLVTLRLRALVLSVDPEACEVVRPGDRAATFGIGPKKMSEGYCLIMPHKNWVNLGFYRGVDIADPDGLLEGTGAKMRHIKIRTLAECDNPALGQMVQEAKEERRTALAG